MSCHNLREIYGDSACAADATEQFDALLTAAVTEPDHGARLSFAARASDSADGRGGRCQHRSGRRIYSERLLGKAHSGFQFC